MTWHAEQRVVVVSHWQGPVCTAATRVDVDGSAEIISFLAGSLAIAASAPPAAPRAPALPWWQRMIDRLRRPRAAVVTMPEPEPIVRWRGESAG
jgi:hypothetical protein